MFADPLNEWSVDPTVKFLAVVRVSADPVTLPVRLPDMFVADKVPETVTVVLSELIVCEPSVIVVPLKNRSLNLFVLLPKS